MNEKSKWPILVNFVFFFFISKTLPLFLFLLYLSLSLARDKLTNWPTDQPPTYQTKQVKQAMSMNGWIHDDDAQ